MNYNKLSPEEEEIILRKGTEAPFSGKYLSNKEAGYYLCKQCNHILYASENKFESGCGWPSFDEEIIGAVLRVPDKDGRRTEIICKNCKAHLGHVFLNEGFTPKNVRHCVNSLSLIFIPDTQIQKAYFASGCFWGTEFHFSKVNGVLSTTTGYLGGKTENPTYKEVCTGNTGHLEAIEVLFNPEIVSYESLVKLFFETHDFTQTNGQGPDIGSQYLSAIFYSNEHQKEVAHKYLTILKDMGYLPATKLLSSKKFWAAEDYHQDYYKEKGTNPYCHIYRKIFP